MIPKIIHYCWFGGKEKPTIIKQCLESWKINKGYKIIEWNEHNFNINCCSYVKDAYKSKMYAFVTDYVRLWALYTQGGIYMDSDVEVLKPLDAFLKDRAFTGHETSDLMVTATMGAEPNHPWIKKLLDYYKDAVFNPLITNTQVITEISKKLVIKKDGGKRFLKDGVTIYSIETFCPFDHQKLVACPTQDTYCVHHFAGTWKGRTQV